ncbi:MAG: hypothetical protein NVS1B12_14660 [Acidimicrobiales bacterium]
MELTNEFRVGVPVDQAWAVLTDVERIAPCLPGAQLQEIEGDQYRGVVKVKVGPITAQYKGTATFIEKDDTSHVAVLRAEGRDTRGQGNANATVTATLVADGNATAVKVVTDLTITGKVAQFGRGVLADVSGKLIGQFVENLERDVLSGSPDNPATAPTAPTAPPASAAKDPAPAAKGPATASAPAPAPAAAPKPAAVAVADDRPSTNGASSTPPAGIRRIDSPEAKPVDLLSTAGSPVAKRLLPALGGLLVIVVLWRLLRHRS